MSTLIDLRFVFQWIKEVRYICKEVPIVLVATKTDLRREIAGSTDISLAEGHRLAESIGAAYYLECSAIQLTGVKEVFETAARTYLSSASGKIKENRQNLLISFPWSEAGCKDDLRNNTQFMVCSLRIVGHVMNYSESMKGQTGKGNNLMCSPEGKAAFGCILEYIVECPELMTRANGSNPLSSLNEVDGFDGIALLSQGIETVCAILVGPCSKVTNCFSTNTTNGGVMKRGVAPNIIDYYQHFVTWSSQLCGERKAQMECLKNTLDHCPASITNWVKKKFEQGISNATADEYEVVSYQDTKNFILNECPKMPNDFSEDPCIRNILLSSNFGDCNNDASMEYSQDKSCMVHALTKPCIEEQLKPCGDDSASFFARNTHIIFPGIPSTCEMTSFSNVTDVALNAVPFRPLLLLSLFSVISVD